MMMAGSGVLALPSAIEAMGKGPPASPPLLADDDDDGDGGGDDDGGVRGAGSALRHRGHG